MREDKATISGGVENKISWYDMKDNPLARQFAFVAGGFAGVTPEVLVVVRDAGAGAREAELEVEVMNVGRGIGTSMECKAQRLL